MSRYIDAEKLERFLNREEWGTPDERWRPESEFGAIVDAIPTADVAPVRHAYWIRKSYFPDGTPAFICSLCGRAEECEEPYCNCGAKMDGKENEK